MTNEYTNEELAAASGEGTYRASRALQLNEVLINGDGDVHQVDGKLERKGGYFRKRVLVGHTDKNTRPEEINLGTPIRVVFLKIRRRLVERGEKGKIVCSTNEHNAKTDPVTLYIADTKEQKQGVAEDIRAAYPNLRTVQIVYALLLGKGEPELVRLIVKGAALGSEAKAESVPTFYQYVSSFPKQDHMWEYETELHAIVEEGAKSYFTIDFKRGKKLDEKTLSIAKTTLMDVALNCKEVDAARAAKIVDSAKVENAPAVRGNTEADFEETQVDSDDDVASRIPF